MDLNIHKDDERPLCWDDQSFQGFEAIRVSLYLLVFCALGP